MSEPPRESTRVSEATTGPDQIESEHWQALLSGESPEMRRLRNMWRRVPHGPRCKVCSAPFAGPGGLATRLLLHGRSIANPTMCTTCFKALASHPGGTELAISVLFADVRGSTGLAETMGAGAFRAALQRFYGFAAAAVERSSLPAAGFRVGAGVHCGVAFVGVLGSGDTFDFSALGDPVNVAARLGGLAAGGEVLASRDVWAAAGRPLPEGSARRVEIAGRQEPLDVVAIPGPRA